MVRFKKKKGIENALRDLDIYGEAMKEAAFAATDGASKTALEMKEIAERARQRLEVYLR